MNQHLKYSKNSVKKGFTNDIQVDFWHNSDAIANAEQSTQEVYDMANNCRGDYQPIFVSDSQYLPNDSSMNIPDTTTLVVTTTMPPITDTKIPPYYVNGNMDSVDVMALTNPPKKDDMLLKGLLIGVVAVILIKTLS
jgi:hypothetical protein